MGRWCGVAVEIRVNPEVSDDALNGLISAAWEGLAAEQGIGARLRQHSLAYLCAFEGTELVGFVNVAWDGGVHGFILDTTVHPNYQRCGIGTALVEKAAELAKERGLEWLHVDYEEELKTFYKACGFRPTRAGLIKLRGVNSG